MGRRSGKEGRVTALCPSLRPTEASSAENEIARYVRRAVQGFEATDQTIDLELIRRVGVGGNYLAEEETARGFREFVNLSPFFSVEPWGLDAASREAQRWERLAHQRARGLLANEVPCPLSQEHVEAADEIVREALAVCRAHGQG